MSRPNSSALYMREPIRHTLEKIWDYPLTVVEAPMGYGKTTAVKEYLKDSEAGVLWHTLPDGSASGFWRGLCRLLKKVDPISAERLAKLGVPSNSLFMEAALEIMSNVVFAHRTVIVLDDFHLLDSKNVEQFLEQLAKSSPRHLNIVIISRVMFGENMTELVLKGTCNNIGKSCFEFAQGEIVEYYKLCGIRLKPQEASRLHDYTEGWISALYLCLLSFLQSGRIEPQESLKELIEKAVYRKCSEQVKNFLLTLCVFDSFTLAQAKAMWPKEEVEPILRTLMATNAFIKYDKFNQTYRIHNIFTGYLREILGSQSANRQQVALLLAASWYSGIGDYLNAMEFCYQAGEFDNLLQALELDNARTITAEHKERMIRYFRECPAEVKRNHPVAGLIFARKMFSFNERALYVAQCKETGEFIETIREEKTRRQLRGELELILSFSKYNDIVGMVEHQAKAAELLDGPSRLFDNRSFWTFHSPSVLYMFYRKSGAFDQEVEALLRFMPRYGLITAGHGAGAEYVMQAECHYYRGDFENAGIVLHKAMVSARNHRQIAIILCVLFLQARLAFVAGALDEVRNFLQQMRQEIADYGQYQLVHTVDLCEGFVYSCLCEAKKIPAWIAAGNLTESQLYFPSHAFFNIIYGKSLLIEGQYQKLIGIAGQFRAIAEVFPNLLGHVYTHIYVAAAHYQLKRYAEARESLGAALEIAVPDQLILPFVENGEHILPLLTEMGNSGPYAGFVGSVTEKSASYAKKVAAMRTGAQSGGRIANLTAREMEIAGLVATGLSNRDIAERLFIEEVTVKKTLQNVFAKLGISSRTVLAGMVLDHKNG